MVLLILQIVLGTAAVYCFGVWVYVFSLTRVRRISLSDAQRAEIAQLTFRLGICGIEAAGFLGLILVLQGT